MSLRWAMSLILVRGTDAVNSALKEGKHGWIFLATSTSYKIKAYTNLREANAKAERTWKQTCHLCSSIFLAANVLQLTEYKPGNLSVMVWTVMPSIFKARNLTCVYPLHTMPNKQKSKNKLGELPDI